MKKLTVDRAISTGQKIVNYPVMAIMLIGIGLTVYLMAILKNPWLFPIGLVLTFGMMWLWWSFMITKWRIWAFENCRNVHALKRRAINEKLIWPDGSKFEKTEIRTFEQRAKLKKINRKFEQEDEIEIIEDDKSVQDETKIYYSRVSLAFQWIIAIGSFLFGAYLVIDGAPIGYVLFLISLFSCYSAFKQSKIKEPYIVLNSEGIKTLNTSFTPWEKVAHANIELQGSGKNAKWLLDIELNHPDQNGEWGDHIEIDDLSISPKKIRSLIELYKQRNRVKNSL